MEGNKISRDLWEIFLRKNQRFLTYCMECAYIYNLKKLRNKKLISALNNNNNLNVKVISKKFTKPFVLGILHNWLYEARAKILFKKLNIRNRLDKEEDSSSESSILEEKKNI